MKKINLLFLGLLFSCNVLAQKSDISSEIERLLISMKSYTIAIAEQMPGDKFEYRPSESSETRTFSQHFKHMKNFMNFQLMLLNEEDLSDFTNILKRNKEYELGNQSKAQVIADLSTQFDQAIAYFKNTDDRDLAKTYTFFFEAEKPSRSRRLIAMALRDHISHHRAQALIYLRENGIKPVQYQRY